MDTDLGDYQMTRSNDWPQEPLFHNSLDDRDVIVEGFSALVQLTEPALSQLATHVDRLIDPNCPIPPRGEMEQEVGVPAGTLSSIMRAVSILTLALYSPPEWEIGRFLDEAVHAGFVREEDRPGVESFFTKHLHPHSEDIRSAMSRDRASSLVIPSFRNLNVTTDVRVRFSGSNPITVPIALVLLATDVDEKDLVFQMTLRDAHYIRRRLDWVIETLDKLRSARLEREAPDGNN